MATTSEPLAHTITGWAIHRGETLTRTNGQRVEVCGREGNVMLVRRLSGAAILRPSLLTRTVERVHPAELGLRSTVKLPAYAQ